jgi:hypothetical protein
MKGQRTILCGVKECEKAQRRSVYLNRLGAVVTENLLEKIVQAEFRNSV